MWHLRFFRWLGLGVLLGACDAHHPPTSQPAPAQVTAADSAHVQLPVTFQAEDDSAWGSDSFARRRQDPLRRHILLHRQPAEKLEDLLHRVVPHFFPDSAWHSEPGSDTAFAWRPTRFGKQQVLFRRGPAAEGGYLFLLDPISHNTYGFHVFQVLAVENIWLEALTLVDVDQDGRAELLALYNDNYKETLYDEHALPGQPKYLQGHADHFFTQVYRYIGFNRQGLPQYREDVHSYSYLDNLATMAQVRRALVRHQRRQLPPPPAQLPTRLIRVDSALRLPD